MRRVATLSRSKKVLDRITRKCKICGHRFLPNNQPDGCLKDVCGQTCQKKHYADKARRLYLEAKAQRKEAMTPEQKLNDFDYVFPNYYEVVPWTPPFVRTSASA